MKAFAIMNNGVCAEVCLNAARVAHRRMNDLELAFLKQSPQNADKCFFHLREVPVTPTPDANLRGLCDLMQERISEDGWHFEPTESGYLTLVPPVLDPLRRKATKWRSYVIRVPDYIENLGR